MVADDAVSVEVAAVEEAETPQPDIVALTIAAVLPSASSRLRVLCFFMVFLLLIYSRVILLGKAFPGFRNK